MIQFAIDNELHRSPAVRAGASDLDFEESLPQLPLHEGRRYRVFGSSSVKTLAAEAIRHGDPTDPDVICGPLIDKDNADRVSEWIGSATDAGGRLLAGGEREGNVISPALIEEAPSDHPVVADEVFGPVACFDPYEDFAQALNMVNDSSYGLQAGIFITDTGKIQEAWRQIETGGIIQGDVPTWRTDPMPYGGVKGSGVGREGPAYTYRELTEERLLVLKR